VQMCFDCFSPDDQTECTVLSDDKQSLLFWRKENSQTTTGGRDGRPQ
jgi:hypothetical protein